MRRLLGWWWWWLSPARLFFPWRPSTRLILCYSIGVGATRMGKTIRFFWCCCIFSFSFSPFFLSSFVSRLSKLIALVAWHLEMSGHLSYATITFDLSRPIWLTFVSISVSAGVRVVWTGWPLLLLLLILLLLRLLSLFFFVSYSFLQVGLAMFSLGLDRNDWRDIFNR